MTKSAKSILLDEWSKTMTRDKMNPFHVYERHIEQNLYFVVCDTRLPYPECIKAHHGSWDEANRHCVALNRDANEKNKNPKR